MSKNQLLGTSIEYNKGWLLIIRTSTDPVILRFIIDGLRQWFRHPRTDRQILHETVWQQEQQQIGWHNFVTGLVSTSMVAKQQHFYKKIGTWNKGKQWASKIIVLNWHMMFKMWLGRNEVLHQKDIINSLSGAALLDIEIERLYEEGYADLPQTAKKWFRICQKINCWGQA
jgi:hypothetical protein